MDQIITVPSWRWVWWDIENSREVRFALTGTYPTVDWRPIRESHGKQLHSADYGEIISGWFTRWEGSVSYTTVWKECRICGKKFDIQEM